ncbi:MAG: tetratricopeptide repeat protein [Flavobacteriales bacterium]
MNEGKSPRNERSGHAIQCVQRYESMLHRNEKLFFDVEEFETIIGHYLEQNEWRRAKQVLDLAVEQHPGSNDLLFCEAQVLMGMGKLNPALGVLDRLEKIEPFNEDIPMNKAAIFSQLRDHRRSIEYYKKALKLAEEGHDEILLDLAFEYENIEAFEDAIQSLLRAADINPENDAVLYELAYCYDLAGRNDQCIVYFRQFTDKHPYAFVAWYNLGNALAIADRIEDSNEALDLSIAIDERFTSAYFSKARNLLMMGRYEEAVQCYRETQEFDGPQAVTFSYIGECFEKMERFNEALIHYDQSLALDPNWTDAWIGRGVVKDLQGRTAEAIKDLEIATRIQPDHPDAWYYMANTLGRAAQYERSLAAYTKLNGLDAGHLEGWLDHADMLLHLKGPDAAMKKLKEGEMVHKLTSAYRFRMVSYLLRCGREQQGLLELEEALMSDPKGHKALTEHYPEALNLPQVVHIIGLYDK